MKAIHNKLVFERRVEVLASHLGALMPQGASVLDIGAGSGDMAVKIMSSRSDVSISGVDVLVRPNTAIKVTEYDGETIPAEDNSYDVSMLVDVLHHTPDPKRLMAEASRVARKGVLIKDHFSENAFDKSVLSFMDWVGNAAHGVRLPYNYLARAQWEGIWDDLSLTPREMREALGLYQPPFNLLFDRNLHFVTFLESAKEAVAA